jgi:hypothetical protein
LVSLFREKLLQDQLRAATQSVQNMQRLHEYGQSQLFDLQAQSEEISAAKQSELNLLTDEVDRAQSRLLSLEREKVYSIFHAYGIFVSVMQLQGNSVRVAEVGTGLQLLLVAVSLDFQQNLSAFSYHVNHVLC